MSDKLTERVVSAGSAAYKSRKPLADGSSVLVWRTAMQGQAIPLTAEEESRLDGLGALLPVGSAPGEPGSKSVDDMTVRELREYAAAHGVDLGDASKKDEILRLVKKDEAAE